jgi:hypothetical protein
MKYTWCWGEGYSRNYKQKRQEIFDVSPNILTSQVDEFTEDPTGVAE